MTDVLAVWLGDRLAGRLRRGRRQALEFDPEANAPGISAGVRRSDDWTSERATAWFDGLLPEGETRSRMAARFGVSVADSFGLLEAIGWECAGAISVLPAGRTPSIGTYRRLDGPAVGERLDALPGRPHDDDATVRASLGGIQSKLVLARRDGSWLEPIDGAPSTHILKPEPDVWPGIAAAEAWALRLAAQVTPAARVEVRTDLGSRPVLVVERFDRRGVDPIERLHQEDLCQLLALPVEAKYAEPPPKPWKPSLARLAGILLERSADPPSELQTLLRQVIVSIALGNADAHAKNLSVLHVDGHVALAPMYDVVPTLAFLPRQAHAALPIGGRYRLPDIGADQVIAEANSWGLPERLARRVLDDSVLALEAAFEEVPGEAVPQRVRDVTIGQFRRFTGSVRPNR